jgi:catechol 2,3-dioxygenase-like lactoylglutathione lyase family enzyme
MTAVTSGPALVLTETLLKFHVSLNAAHLPKAVKFYQALFGVEPVKNHMDYVKFELANPPLVLSIKPQNMGRGGTLNHLGFRVANAEQLVEVQRRLESAGFRTGRQDGVECCYARQTKFWVADPDGTLWEIYVLEGDIDHKGTAHGLSGMLAPIRALGWFGAMRRGIHRPMAALSCWWSHRGRRQESDLPKNDTAKHDAQLVSSSERSTP